MKTGGLRVVVAFGIVTGSLCAVLAPGANAQISKPQQVCISTFNKGIRSVAKAQAGIVRKCLSDYAAGRLTSSTPEDCVRSDPKGDLDRAVISAASKTAEKCDANPPGFGVTDLQTALSRAALGQLDLTHASLGRDLDDGLIPDQASASCQAKVGAAMLKCADRRLREFLKCQKLGLRTGAITDAASLAATCLGSGGSPQPDPSGRIAKDCGVKVAAELAKRCTDTDLAAAFAPCNPADLPAASNCLRRKSGCETCLMLNDVDGLTRDCDALDDGDAGNGSCGRECADGILQTDEACDDGDLDDLDGCSALCQIEGGYECSGEPSVCTLKCGNGGLDAGEGCDDGDAQDGDGCASTCDVESGYECSGAPSVCTPRCGNGDIEPDNGEVCDDGDFDSGDGCSASCQVEPGHHCSGEPSVCPFVCGNGTFQPGESCDDGDASAGDGCSGACTIEPGWSCLGQPSFCSPICGDGLLRGGEPCDDDNTAGGDGCSPVCLGEAGFTCGGEPSNCVPVCGDGFVRGFETCDDGNNTGGDGCSANFCLQESSYACLGQPSVCNANCGNGDLDVPEECDDGDNLNGDGCRANCTIEAGYFCAGEPSLCVATCGNGMIDGAEQCDDGNTVSRDGCSAGCRNESGWLCSTPGAACLPFTLTITSPANGIFTTAASVTVTGSYTLLPAGQVAVTVNGVPASTLNQVARTFSHSVPISQGAIFNPIRVTLTNLANGDDIHARVTVIGGPSVADGAFSPQSVGMRINDSGLDSIEPLVAGLAAGQLNLGSLIPAGMTLINDQCFISVIGCWGSASVRIANPPPSFGSFQLLMDSKANAVLGDIRINNIRLDIQIDGSGLVPDCGLRLTASQLRLTGDYALEPLAGQPSTIDVNLVTPLSVNFAGFNQTFTSGICDDAIIGDIIQSFLPDIEAEAVNAMKGFLADPDGSGPQDSPIAAAIQTTLDGISISGPVGEGVGLMFESPLFAVTEDVSGITLGSNSRFQVSVGSGPGQCIPPPGAPNLTASYSKPAAFPSFGPSSPVLNQPYGLGIAISSAGFNQLLKGQTECGLMRTSLTSLDLDGEGGQPPLTIDSTLLSLLVPEFAQLPPGTPLRIDVAPTTAPIVTGDPGPGGTLTELRLGHALLNVVEPGPETVWLGGVIDAEVGFNLSFDGSGLSIGLAPPQSGAVRISIITNPLGTNEAQVESFLPALLEPLFPQLAGALSGFPLPEFFGLSLQGVEVSRSGQFMGLYTNLTAAP